MVAKQIRRHHRSLPKMRQIGRCFGLGLNELRAGRIFDHWLFSVIALTHRPFLTCGLSAATVCAMGEPFRPSTALSRSEHHLPQIAETIRRLAMSIAATEIRLDRRVKSFVKERRKLLIDGK